MLAIPYRFRVDASSTVTIPNSLDGKRAAEKQRSSATNAVPRARTFIRDAHNALCLLPVKAKNRVGQIAVRGLEGMLQVDGDELRVV